MLHYSLLIHTYVHMYIGVYTILELLHEEALPILRLRAPRQPAHLRHRDPCGVCVCVCVCVCHTQTHTHAHTYICVCTDVCTYIHTHIHAYYVGICIHTNVCMYAYMHTYIYM